MTTEQKIDRLMARVGRLQAQAQAKVDAGFVQPSTGARLRGYMVGRAAPTTDQPPAQTSYYSYFTSSVSKVLAATKTAAVSADSAVKAAVVSTGSAVKAAVVRAGSAAKAVVMGAGAIAKQAAIAVCWTAPNWAWSQVLRGGAAVADGVWVVAEALESVVYTTFSMLLLASLVITVGYVIVTALTTTIGVAIVLATLWMGMLSHLHEDARQATRRNAARPW